MLSKIEDLDRALAKEKTTSSALRSDCDRLRKDVQLLKTDNVQLANKNQHNDLLIEHLHKRQVELEQMQSTAQETVLDSEGRLSSAMEQLVQLQAVSGSNHSTTIDVLTEAAVETARNEANELRSKLRVTSAELDRLRRSRDLEAKMRTNPYHQREEENSGGEEEASSSSLGMSLSVLAKDSTLSTVRHLETIIEAQGLTVIELRQKTIRQGMQHRSQLRLVEEDMSHRNGRISMLQSALRQRSMDQDTKIHALERTVRVLRQTSDLHEDVTRLSTECKLF